jgi:hypothetical protein
MLSSINHKVITYVIFILFIVVIKIMVNLYKLIRCQKIYALYKQYVSRINSDFVKYIPAAKKLFYEAGIEDSIIPAARPIGYGYIVSANVSSFKNMQFLGSDVVPIIDMAFNQASTIFKQNIVDAINPLYWLDLVVFLPKHITYYLNIPSDNIGVKILQIIWWILNLTFLLFKDYTIQFLKSLLRIP